MLIIIISNHDYHYYWHNINLLLTKVEIFTILFNKNKSNSCEINDSNNNNHSVKNIECFITNTIIIMRAVSRSMIPRIIFNIKFKDAKKNQKHGQHELILELKT